MILCCVPASENETRTRTQAPPPSSDVAWFCRRKASISFHFCCHRHHHLSDPFEDRRLHMSKMMMVYRQYVLINTKNRTFHTADQKSHQQDFHPLATNRVERASASSKAGESVTARAARTRSARRVLLVVPVLSREGWG